MQTDNQKEANLHKKNYRKYQFNKVQFSQINNLKIMQNNKKVKLLLLQLKEDNLNYIR